jgi:hypothetical protein
MKTKLVKSVYCLSSTIGQQNREDRASFKFSEAGSVMISLNIQKLASRYGAV